MNEGLKALSKVVNDALARGEPVIVGIPAGTMCECAGICHHEAVTQVATACGPSRVCRTCADSGHMTPRAAVNA